MAGLHHGALTAFHGTAHAEFMTRTIEVVANDAGLSSEPRVPRTSSVTACPLCGAADAGLLFRGSDRLCGTPGEFLYRRCASCLTVFQDPRVISEDLHLCYPDGYLTHVPPARLPSIPDSRRPLSRFRERLRCAIVGAVQGQPTAGALGRIGRWLASSRYLRERAFNDYVPDVLLPLRSGTMRALEIGCGSGELLRGLTQVGWDAEGIEVDPIAAQLAREVSGQPVREGDFRKLALQNGSYDLIVLNHVLEHLEDPIIALKRTRELLAPGGRVALFYPNPAALGARIYGAEWLAWDVPRHLVIPTWMGLAKQARRSGLILTQVRSTARTAEGVLAHSRAYRKGRSVVLGNYSPSVYDRSLALLERALVCFGFFVGEEIIMELKVHRDEEPVTGAAR